MTDGVLRGWAVLAVAASLSVGRADPPKQPDEWEFRVKTTTVGVSPSSNLKGIVGKIDANGLTLVEVSNLGEVTEHTFRPIDILRKGEIRDGVNPRDAYRWEDVKPGDSVELRVAEDHIDKQMYCLNISIERRPKG